MLSPLPTPLPHTLCTEQTELLVPTIVEFARDKNVVQIAAGNEHTAILCENGDLVSAIAREWRSGSLPNELHVPPAVLVRV